MPEPRSTSGAGGRSTLDSGGFVYFPQAKPNHPSYTHIKSKLYSGKRISQNIDELRKDFDFMNYINKQ